MEIVFAAAIAVTAAVALVRLTLWCAAPRTRLLTVAAALLALGAILIEPRCRDNVDSFVATGGFAGIIADVLLLAAACLLCAYVARVWDNEWLHRAALTIALAGGLVLIVVYAIAEYAGSHRGHTGDVNSLATVYGLLLSLLMIAVNASVLITVALARPVARVQLWFAASASSWIVLAVLRGAATADPGRYADLFWQWRIPLDTLVLLTGSAIGLSNLRSKRRTGVVAATGWTP
ncbi:hypothetical protein ACWEOI_07755 [Nocardia sp. NPDC004340]